MEYKVFNSYGGFSLKSEEGELTYLGVRDKIVETLFGDKGYIRLVGTNNVREHGYSAEENIYKIITLDYNVINLPNVIKINLDEHKRRLVDNIKVCNTSKDEIDEDELWREDFKKL